MNTAAKIAALGLAFMLAQAPAAGAAEQAMTTQSVMDRVAIEDLLTRYYNNFGAKGGESFAAFYAPDAELVLGKNSYKGREGIEGAYKAVPQDTPQRKSYSFNVLPTNVQIIVHGNTATAQLLFTEIVIDKQGDAPRILTQGREFDHLVKLKGQWLLSKRQIMGAADQPAGWPN